MTKEKVEELEKRLMGTKFKIYYGLYHIPIGNIDNNLKEDYEEAEHFWFEKMKVDKKNNELIPVIFYDEEAD